MTEQLVGFAADTPGLAFLRHRPDDEAGLALTDALVRTAGPHVPRLLDIGTAANGDTVLVLADDPVRLPELLARPDGFTRGEAVTILVPLLRAVDRAHAAGVAHGALGPGAVRFSRDGTPVLHDWAQAVLVGRHGPLAFAAAAERDDAALAALAGRLLGDEVGEQVAACGAEQAVDALFDLAEPEPVRLESTPIGRDLRATPGRLGGVTEPAQTAPRRWRLRGVAQRGTAALRTVRPRVWAAAAVSVLLLVAALVLLPGRGADAAGPALPAPSATGLARPTASPSGSGAVAPRPLAAAAAATALLRARATCTTSGCLARVDAAGAPVTTSDALTIRDGRRPAGPGSAPLHTVSTLGAATVLSAGRWTVLVVRQADGWRLRDVVEQAR